jgi:hypothetical protein
MVRSFIIDTSSSSAYESVAILVFNMSVRLIFKFTNYNPSKCWPLVPKFAGSNPAKAVEFFERKNPQHAFLRRGSKAVCPMLQFCGILKNPTMTWKSHLLG